MFFCIRQTCFSVFFLGALTPATFYITQRNKTLQQTKWWARVGSHHYRRFFRPLSRLLDDEPKLKCTSTGFEPARLSATFLQDLVWISTIRVIACFYQTQLPLCVYLFRHECIKVFNIHHPSSNCHFLHQYSIDSCMNAASF